MSAVIAAEIVQPHSKTANAPARFESWPDDVYQRAKDLWSTVAGRNAAAVERLLAAESGDGIAIPAAATIRRWAADDGWDVQADHDLEHSRGRTLRRLQAGWLAALEMAQATLIQGMSGGLDDAPYGGSARIKSAEIVLRTIERAGLLATLPDPAPPSDAALHQLTPTQQSRALREAIAAEREQEERRRRAG